MPATSQNMQIATAIAEHHPEKLYARNKGMLGMTQQQLHDFASTRRKGLPKRKGPKPSAHRKVNVGNLMGHAPPQAGEDED